MATAVDLPSPATTNQTSRAAHSASKPIEMRVGGGFGQPWTPKTRRSSCAAGDSGKIDAVWPSPPMPSSSTSNGGTSWSAGAAALSSSA